MPPESETAYRKRHGVHQRIHGHSYAHNLGGSGGFQRVVLVVHGVAQRLLGRYPAGGIVKRRDDLPSLGADHFVGVERTENFSQVFSSFFGVEIPIMAFLSFGKSFKGIPLVSLVAIHGLAVADHYGQQKKREYKNLFHNQ